MEDGGGQRGHGGNTLRKCEGCFVNGRCTLLIKVECWHLSDYCWVEVNLATLSCWACYQIVNIGLSHYVYYHCFCVSILYIVICLFS